MKAFMVSINGQPFVTAGVGDDGVLSAHVTWSGGSWLGLPEGLLGLLVRGSDGRTGEQLCWSAPEIGVGDEVTIKVIETDQVSPEDERYRLDLDRDQAEKGRTRVVELNCRPGGKRKRGEEGPPA